MKVNSNLQALSNITLAQEVSANNMANLLSSGFRASRALQQGDSVSISREMRDAIRRNEAATAPSDVDPTREQVEMRRNEASYEANLNAIRTKERLYETLDKLKR